jgi:hypothetical protein
MRKSTKEKQLEHRPESNGQAQVVETQTSSHQTENLSKAKGLSNDRIEEMRLQLSLLREFVAKVMIKGEHYGVIPGTSKPTLLKAGAEFLREAYGFEVRSTCVERKFIPARDNERGKDYIEYSYRVELFQSGVSVGICEGSCNNFERRYENMNPFAVMNTIQKMAQKRAYVGAVISATRSSNIFTQDLEDEPELVLGNASKKIGNASTASVTPNATTEKSVPTMASPNQAKLVWARLKNELKLSDHDAREFIREHAGKTHSRDLTSDDIELLLEEIDKEASATGGSAALREGA